MRGSRALVCACALAGACGFRHGIAASDGSVGGGDARDARGSADGPPDAATAVPIYATDPDNLYTIDVVNHTFALVGPLVDSLGESVGGVDSIAYDHGTLVVIGHDGTGQSVGTIDRTSGLVTFDVVPLTNAHSYYGATYDPTNDTIYAASNDDAKLYSVNATAGTTTLIGAFGGGLTVYGDIAWVGGSIYGTMVGGACNPGCIAKINPATGAATALSTTAPGALPSLAVYEGALYAFSGGGDVYSVNLTTGATTLLFNAGGLDLGDAAP